MLKKVILDKLNHQINLEFYSSNLYLQMSAWAAGQKLEGCANFLKQHAVEEMQHMQKLFEYVLQTGNTPILGQIDSPKANFDNIKEVFNDTFEHEKFITKTINELVEASFLEKDFSTFQFLQWYVAEQHEEEALFQSILDKIDLVGSDSKNIYFLDKEIGNLAQA